jgi:hypothetical protein
MPTIVVTCDARTGEAPDDYGFRPLWCRTGIGLREFFDAQGTVRRYCAAVGHKEAVEGRYGKRRSEVREAVTAAFSRSDWEARKAQMDAEQRAEMLADRELMIDEFHGRSW